MATNNYFSSNYYGTAEQTLINGLMKECIQQQGYDMYYMPREDVNFDYLFGEDSLPNYNKVYQIEAYIKDVQSYGGQGQFISKLGLDIQDDLTIQISIDRFDQAIRVNQPEIIRPREGDLMYFGLDKHTIMEIAFVENKTPFFQLGKLYLYEINLKRFVYGAQNITTGIDEIDEVNEYGDVLEIILGTSLNGTTTYLKDEMVYQLNPDMVSYRASADVLSHDGNVLRVCNVFGDFVSGVAITGEVSGASYNFPVKNDETYDKTSANKIADNVEVKSEGVDFIDDQETNPFVDF